MGHREVSDKQIGVCEYNFDTFTLVNIVRFIFGVLS